MKTKTNVMNKIKILLLVIVLAAVTHVASAQAQFAVGIKAGPNFANVNTSASAGENYKNRTGFHGGAFALIKVANIGIQPEVLFSQQGSTVHYSTGQDLDTQISYINVPLILKLYTVAGINLQVGPQLGFVNKAKAEQFVSGVPTTTGAVQTYDIKSSVKQNDFAVALGAGWDLPFGLTIDARYNLGLTKSKISNSSTSPQAKNQVFQVSVGFKLLKFGK
jgi:hypothetical protein